MSVIGLTRIGGAPLYRQVADRLEEELRAHASPGQKLPAEEELAARFGVHRHTLRRAIDELVDAGLVERRHGLGTFVVRAPVTYALSGRTRFTATLATLGREADSAVLRKQRILAEGGVAARLQLTPGTLVTWVETLRRVDRAPFCVISHFVADPWGEAVFADYEGGSLHGFLETRFVGLRLRRSETLLSVSLPRGDDATLLEMPHHRPVLRAKSVNLCATTGTPVEYALTRFHGERAQLRLDFPDQGEPS